MDYTILLYKIASSAQCDLIRMVHARPCCSEQNGTLHAVGITRISPADGVLHLGPQPTVWEPLVLGHLPGTFWQLPLPALIAQENISSLSNQRGEGHEYCRIE